MKALIAPLLMYLTGTLFALPTRTPQIIKVDISAEFTAAPKPRMLYSNSLDYLKFLLHRVKKDQSTPDRDLLDIHHILSTIADVGYTPKDLEVTEEELAVIYRHVIKKQLKQSVTAIFDPDINDNDRATELLLLVEYLEEYNITPEEVGITRKILKEKLDAFVDQ